MTKARIEYVASSDKATLYTIWFEGKTMSEFAEFYEKQNNQPMTDEQSEFMKSLIESIWEGEK